MLRKIIRITLLIYLIALGWILFIRPSFSFSRLEHRASKRMYNTIPFHTLNGYISSFPDYYKYHGLSTWVMNVVGNIVMFIPFGLLLPYSQWASQSFIKVITYAFAFSLVVEILQFIFNLGIFDVDDIFLNMLGVIIGWFLYKLLSQIF